MNLPFIDSPLNMLAAYSAFANFVLNSIVAGVIWWRIWQHRVAEVSNHDDRLNDLMFKLAGAGFSILAVMYLSIALGRSGDIDRHTWALSRIAADIGTLCVAAYGSYRMTADRYRYTVPSVLVALSLISAGLFIIAH